MSKELTIPDDKYALMPVMDINQAGHRRTQIVQFARSIMIDGTDFGTIPGTDKPTLYKPGAEKLTTFFGLSKRFEIIERVEDWTGQQHGGEPFFYYLYRCALYKGEMLIAEADGSCSSFESKYRYRKSERECPQCGAAAIIKGREQYGGGWLCWQKKGGCNAKFKDGDRTIEGQEVGRIPNPDVCDQVNTIQKMAQKRALVAATLLAVNASEFFTQDLEDYVIEVQAVEVVDEPQRRPRENTPPAQPAPANGKPKQAAKLYPGQQKFYDAVQAATGNYYNDPAHLVNAVGWPDFSSQDDVDARLSAAVDHANQRRYEPAVEDAA